MGFYSKYFNEVVAYRSFDLGLSLNRFDVLSVHYNYQMFELCFYESCRQ
jgi:hypothetical protein